MKEEKAKQLIDRMKRHYHNIKWDILYRSLLADDAEALAFVAEKTDPRLLKSRRAAAAREEKREKEQAAYEGQGVDLGDIIYKGPAALDRAGRDKRVWLYHGTTTRFIRDIKTRGLVPGFHRIDAKQDNVIYLTASHEGARFYAERAAGQFGGRAVIVRVLVPYNELMWDEDDADISSGNYQWVIDWVPPAMICEIGDIKVKGRC